MYNIELVAFETTQTIHQLKSHTMIKNNGYFIIISKINVMEST